MRSYASNVAPINRGWNPRLELARSRAQIAAQAMSTTRRPISSRPVPTPQRAWRSFAARQGTQPQGLAPPNAARTARMSSRLIELWATQPMMPTTLRPRRSPDRRSATPRPEPPAPCAWRVAAPGCVLACGVYRLVVYDPQVASESGPERQSTASRRSPWSTSRSPLVSEVQQRGSPTSTKAPL